MTGDDYNINPLTLEQSFIAPDPVPVCIEIRAETDEFIESMESLEVTITSSDEAYDVANVDVDIIQSRVTITDVINGM